METEEFIKRMKKEKEILDNHKEFSEKEREILFERIANKIMAVNEEGVSPATENKNTINLEEAPDSFAAMINRAKISQHIDYVLVAAYYLTKNDGVNNFNVKDINYEYKKAWMKPSNTNVYLVNLVKKGLLMSAGKKEGGMAFSITRNGIKYIEDLLQDGE